MGQKKITINRRTLDRAGKQPIPRPYARPKTRGDCADGPRPCPYMGCRYHLKLNVTRAGGIQILPPGGETCALDLAARGGMRPDEVGAVLGVSETRVGEIEAQAFEKLKHLR